ncbi:MAG: hypothetical protein ABN486_08840, partial [Pseudomonas sp.]
AFNQGFRLLPEGRGSELVREYGVSGYAFLAIIPALSRTSSLPRPSARIKSGFVYNDEHSGVGTIARVSPTSKKQNWREPWLKQKY